MFMKKHPYHRGQTFSLLILYPVLLLLGIYGIILFINTTQITQNVRRFYDHLKAFYVAEKAKSYVFYEIRSRAVGMQPFYTHLLGAEVPSGSLIPRSDTIPPVYSLGNLVVINEIDGSKNYCLLDQPNGNVIAEVKVYQRNGNYFILTKAMMRNIKRLFFERINPVSLYDYALFYAGDATIGWKTINANGGKLHANGQFKLNDYVRILNAAQLSTPNKFSMEFTPLIHPDDFSLTQYKQRRFPFMNPNDYTGTVPAAGKGNYVNQLDGHYAGSRTGLLAKKTDGTIGQWNPLDSTQQPIWPWGDSSSFVTDPAWNGVNWATDSTARQYAYYEQNPNCAATPGSCAKDSSANNDKYYEGSLWVNGKYIPSRLPGAPSQDKKVYYGNPTQTPRQVYITESTIKDAGGAEIINSAWSSFLTSIDSASLFKDKFTGGYNITLPTIAIKQAMNEARFSGNAMVIEEDDAGINITVNGSYRYTIPNSSPNPIPACLGSGGTGNAYERKVFMNNRTGQIERTVKVNIGALKACEQYEAEAGKWLPSSGIILVSNHEDPTTPYSWDPAKPPLGLVVANAKQLPEGGLTYIVQGDLILQGQYNNNADGTPLDFSGEQPSSAIVSNRVSLVSDAFETLGYPATLPIMQHHPDYPQVQTVLYDGYSFKKGIGFDKDMGVKDGGTYNWYSAKNAYMPNPVTSSIDTDGDNIKEVHYNISLVGQYATEPDLLERWSYFSTPGSATVHPTGWTQVKPVITGSFIQLSPYDFPRLGPAFVEPNNRSCNQTEYTSVPAKPVTDTNIRYRDINLTPWSSTAQNDATVPCRSAEGKPWDLLTSNLEPKQIYDSNYLTDPSFRPPGDIYGISIETSAEIPLFDPITHLNNWTHCPDACNGAGPWCGNGICDSGENSCGCSPDCPLPEGVAIDCGGGIEQT